MQTHENKERKGDEERLGKWITKDPMRLKHYETHFGDQKRDVKQSEKNKESKLQTIT